jgi:hypothetical protein
MASQLFDQICEHLSSLGYQLGPADMEARRIARHTNKLFILLKDADGAVFFAAFLPVTDAVKKNKVGYLEFVSSLNHGSHVVKFYYDAEDHLVMESCFAGNYDKGAFGSFMTFWHSDTVDLLRAGYAKTPQFLP